MSKIVLKLTNIRKAYTDGKKTLEVVKGVDFSLVAGEVVALVGPSGAGKSTLLHMAALLDQQTSGTIEINGVQAGSLSDKERTLIRRKDIGFVYQFHLLMQEFSALENVIMPQLIAGKNESDAIKNAEKLLESVGLGARFNHRPSELSGGEQQRVAVARAIANDPCILLADEPTGNLDTKTSEIVFHEILELAKEKGIAAVIATHNPDLASRMHRTVHMVDGLILN